MKSYQIDDAFIEIEHGLPKITGNLRSNDDQTLDIYRGLKKILKKNKFVVFRCRKRTLLIWKKYPYFIYDPLGRTQTCNNGSQSALITLKELENVVHVIVNLSDLKNNPTYSLTVLKITKLETPVPPGPIQHKSEPERKPGYHILNTYRAIMRSEYHLQHNIFYETRNKPSLAMSIVALVFTKIDPPATWTVDNLNKIMLLGNRLYKDWSGGIYNPLDIKALPSSFQLAQYGVTISIKPFEITAPVHESGHENLVYEGLKELFRRHNRILLQVGYMFFAVCVKNKVFYLFDPYPRDNEGDICYESTGQCCIQMFSFIQELSHAFRRNMIQTVPEGKVYMHVIEIDDLTKLPPDEQLPTSKPIIETGLNISRTPSEIEEFDNQSKVESIDFQIPVAKAITANEDDMILILDSPTPSTTSVDQVCAVPVLGNPYLSKEVEQKKELRPDQYSKLSLVQIISKTEKLPHKVTPSVDYLCTLATHEFMGDLLQKLPANKRRRSSAQPGASELELIDEDKSEEGVVTAKAILLKSDLSELQKRRQQLKKSHLPLPHEDCLCKEPPITLSQELLIPSNFEHMPDGSGIIFGTKSINSLFPDVFDPKVEYVLPIVAISAVSVSHKYSIATWNPNIVDLILSLAEELKKFIELNKSEAERNQFFTVANHNLPIVEIGHKKYTIRMQMIETSQFKNLYNALDKIFIKLQRVIVLSPSNSIAVFKRKNLYYMFEGYPCNIVGFRSEEGRSCFIRFKSLSSMVRRIEANRKESCPCDTVILSQLILNEVSEQEYFPYPCHTGSQQDAKIRDAKLELVYKEGEKQRQLDTLDRTIEEEKERVRKFKEMKQIKGYHSLDARPSKSLQIISNDSVYQDQRPSTSTMPR